VAESLNLFKSYPAVGNYRDPRTGRVVRLIRPEKAAQKNFWLNSGVTALAAGGPAVTTLNPPRDQGDQGDTEISRLMAQSTGQYSVRLYAEALDRRLMNVPVEGSLVFGTSNWPNYLLESIYVPATSAIRVGLTDLSAAPNNVSLMGHGLQVVNPIANLGRSRSQLVQANSHANTHAYWLTTDAGPQVLIPAGGTATFQATVPSDADFNAWALLSRSDQGVNSFTIDIVEGQRRSLMRAGPVPIGLVGSQTFALAGSPDGIVPACGVPNLFPDTHLFQRNTIIEFRLTDTSGNPNTVSIALAGQLLYFQHAPGGLQALEG